MDIELLRTFLEVVRTRHFGKAAVELCVTQSAVSARIRQLEQAMGRPLFTRQRNNIRLTPGGLQLWRHAETIVQAWARARQETGQREEVTRRLAVGALWDLWETLLRDWLPAMHRDMFNAALQVEAGTSAVLVRKLVDGIIDLAVMFEPPQLPGLEIRELGFINLVLASTQRGQTLEQARAQVSAIARQLDADYPLGEGVGPRFRSVHASSRQLWTVAPLSSRMFGVPDLVANRLVAVVLVAVGLVLLVAATNVANLALARASRRRQDLCVVM